MAIPSPSALSRGFDKGDGRKARKHYTMTKPREPWSAEDHARFLNGMLMFGRDWKRIEEHVRTKTTIQIRSHVQNYFLKVQKLGLTVGLPQTYPRRRLAVEQQGSAAGSSAAAVLPLHGETSARRSPCHQVRPTPSLMAALVGTAPEFSLRPAVRCKAWTVQAV